MMMPNFPAQFEDSGYEFSRVQKGDVAQVRAWMNEPHIVDWWTPSEDEFAEMGNEGIDSPVVRYIVSHNGRPFAYIQCYDPEADYDYWGNNVQESGTYGIDQFIGDPEMIGYGHGINFLKAFVGMVKSTQGVKKIIVDPAPDNMPAIRCYSQVGFRKGKVIETPEGPALIMTLPV